MATKRAATSAIGALISSSAASGSSSSALIRHLHVCDFDFVFRFRFCDFISSTFHMLVNCSIEVLDPIFFFF